MKNEIKKAVIFTIASKRIVYLGINLTKKVWDLYPRNYKVFLKEIKDWSKQEDIQCSWIGSLNIIKVAVPLKLMYRFNKSISKSQLVFFFPAEIGPTDPKIYMKMQRTDGGSSEQYSHFEKQFGGFLQN